MMKVNKNTGYVEHIVLDLFEKKQNHRVRRTYFFLSKIERKNSPTTPKSSPKNTIIFDERLGPCKMLLLENIPVLGELVWWSAVLPLEITCHRVLSIQHGFPTNKNSWCTFKKTLEFGSLRNISPGFSKKAHGCIPDFIKTSSKHLHMCIIELPQNGGMILHWLYSRLTSLHPCVPWAFLALSVLQHQPKVGCVTHWLI